jgi:hypothetical protein
MILYLHMALSFEAHASSSRLFATVLHQNLEARGWVTLDDLPIALHHTNRNLPSSASLGNWDPLPDHYGPSTPNDVIFDLCLMS